MAQVILLLGDQGALRASALSLWEEHVACHGSDAAALILPTTVAAEQARAALMSDGPGGLFDPRVFTFPQLAEAILVANHHPYRRLSPLQRDVLLEHLIGELVESPKMAPLRAYLDRQPNRRGLVRAVADVLDELKRAAVEPSEFAQRVAAALPDHPANGPITAIYEAYQARLKELRVYDEPGLFWEALDLVRAGHLRPLDTVSLLVLHGFAEFTPTQLLLLQALAEPLERMALCLFMDQERPQPFEVTRRTYERLCQVFGGHEVTSCWVTQSPEPPPTTNLARLQRCLFSSEGPGLVGDDDSVRVLAVGGGIRAEARQVARRIKDILLDPHRPAAPGDVAVVLRAFDDNYHRALRDVFAEYGIPFESSHGEAISRSPAVQAVLSILDVVANDWQREDVVKLLNNSYVRPEALTPAGHTIAVPEFEWVALQARVLRGQRSWQQRLGLLSRRLEAEAQRRRSLEADLGIAPSDPEAALPLEDEENVRYRPLREIEAELAAVERCAAVVGRLSALLQPLIETRDWPSAVSALSQAVEGLGIADAIRQPEHGLSTAAQDVAALDTLFTALWELADVAPALGMGGGTNLLSFAQEVRQLCQDLRLSPTSRTGTCVQLLDVHEVRGLRFGHVFLPGLSEGLFPRVQPQDPFYHDEDRRQLEGGSGTGTALAKSGDDGLCHLFPLLEGRASRQADEVFLFLSALTAATQCVWISYPTSEADGSPRLRSWFVDELLRGAEGHAGLRPEELPVSLVIPQVSEACSVQELAEAAFKALDQTPPVVMEVLRGEAGALVRRAFHAARVERERDSYSGPAPGRYQGMVSEPWARELLGQDRWFGPEHRFSPTQLSRYGRCPACFFFAEVLGLKPLGEPTEDVDARDLGSLAHQVLAQLFGRWRKGTDRGRPLRPEDLPEALKELDELLDQVAWPYRNQALHRRLWQLTEEGLREDLRALLDYEAKANVNGKYPPRIPFGCEIVYGKRGSFRIGEGERSVALQGRLDRVDQIEGENAFAVFDYKLGNCPTMGDIRAGAELQLPIYCMVAQRMSFEAPDPQPKWWAYYRIRRPVQWSAVACGDTIPGLLQQTREFILRYVENIRAGQFAPSPYRRTECRTCDFQGICRHRPERRTRKTGPDRDQP